MEIDFIEIARENLTNAVIPKTTYEKLLAERDALKAELASLRGQSVPMGEVVMAHEPEWMEPREIFKWHKTEFPLGTKFYTHPPAQNNNVDKLVLALQLLHDDTAEYCKINNLGGYDNQVMVNARKVLDNYKDTK